ncbi:MAG: nickel-dependent lactate racemase, partial [Desulfobacteraceae bacterium]|nr:nickel-dependent lactate racemase [Desulfobacteraceae bacterium]
IKKKKIAVIIPDYTRLWARGDLFVPVIVKTLLDQGAIPENITIIIALGSHKNAEPGQYSTLAGTYCNGKVQILNAANKDKKRLVSLGKTYKGTDLFITKEAHKADHVIIFGGILHHLIAGFGGGRKYILPGIAGFNSIQQNHSLSIKKDGRPDPLVRQAKLWGNPVNEDMNDAATMFLKGKTSCYAAVAANGTGDIFYAKAGNLTQTFMEGCQKLNDACSVPVKCKGDFALISAGGYRTDGELYQSIKALFNAVGVVKERGDILFVADAFQGIGNKTFGQALVNFKGAGGHMGKELAKQFNMPSYIAFRVIDILQRFNVTLVSSFDKETTQNLGFKYTDNLEAYLQQLHGKGYIIPYAENILPLVTQ